MDLPADVSNGLPPNLPLNILPSVAETKISYVAPDKKPRLVRISIKPTGSVPFSVGGLSRKATEFTLHVEFGGIAGVVVPVEGNEPPDYHIWLESGSPPAFLGEEGPLYEAGDAQVQTTARDFGVWCRTAHPAAEDGHRRVCL